MLDIAHRAACDEATVLGLEAVEQRVQRFVQQRPLAGIRVVQLIPVRRQVVRNSLPIIEKSLDRRTERRKPPHNVSIARAIKNDVHDLGSDSGIVFEARNSSVRGEVGDEMACRSDDHRGQSTVHRARRPRCHTRCLYRSVESSVEMAETFMMQPIARLVGIEQDKDQSWPIYLTTYAACCLDVFGCCLWLPLDEHQPKPANIETDRNHVCRQGDIDPVLLISARLCQRLFCFSHLAFARCIRANQDTQRVGCRIGIEPALQVKYHKLVLQKTAMLHNGSALY